jgi:hypothetical protein
MPLYRVAWQEYYSAIIQAPDEDQALDYSLENCRSSTFFDSTGDTDIEIVPASDFRPDAVVGTEEPEDLSSLDPDEQGGDSVKT